VDEIPKPSTLHRHELTLDVAMMLLRSRTPSQSLCWSWTDSSPQENYDWVWEQVVEIDQSDVVLCFDAVMNLSAAGRSLSDDELADAMCITPPEWEPWLRDIQRCIRIHIPPPTAVGHGHRSLVHKASAKVHSRFLELHSGERVDSCMRSYRSHTTDLGTEFGMADLRVAAPSSLLPMWLDTVLVPDAEVGDAGQRSPELVADVESEPELAADVKVEPEVAADRVPDFFEEELDGEDSAAFFMPCAFSIPGLHHIIDNLTKALHTKLGYWSSFKAMLDNLESFLTKRELVDTFIWSSSMEPVMLQVLEHRPLRWI